MVIPSDLKRENNRTGEKKSKKRLMSRAIFVDRTHVKKSFFFIERRPFSEKYKLDYYDRGLFCAAVDHFLL